MQWKFSDLVNKELFSFPMFIKRRKTNFLQKSATKQLLAYRYGARKGNLTILKWGHKIFTRCTDTKIKKKLKLF